MLSINAIADAEYYLALGREDYYLAGGEPPGTWFGSAAAALGLPLTVGPELRNLLRGFSPSGDPLIQNAGDPEHQAGWDLTFSAPKSVGVAVAIAAATTAEQIWECHREAVRAAHGYLERNAAFTRRGRGGARVEQVALLFADFEHLTSRAGDPQPHSHSVLQNVALRADGSWGTILSRPIYQHKMAAGAIYRAELAARLTAMGFACRARHGGMFEIEGVPETLTKHFSKRREAIEAALESYGAHSAKAAEIATLATRSGKEVEPRAELLERWKAEAAKFGFTPESVEALRKQKPAAPAGPKNADGVVEGIVREICTQQSHFAKRDVVRRLAEKAPELNLDAELVEAIVHERLQHSADVVRLGEVDHEERYTSRELLRIETEMLETVQRLQSESAQQIGERILASVLRARPKLSAEQVAAVRHLLKADSAVKVVDGMPGTGKTFMLDACRDAWQREGLRVVGCALSAKAARELQGGSGIESCTIAKLVHEWDRGLAERLKHDARQLLRAAMGKRTYAHEGLPLDANTVLVCDESGMVDTPQMLRLVREVERTGATLVLVGDHRQLPAIGPGGSFQAIAREVGCAQLDNMQRQRDSRDLEALRMIAGGDARSALESFRQRDKLTVADSRMEAIEALVSDWVGVGLARPEQTSIITTTNRDAQIINQLCQAARLEMTGASRLLSVKVGEERLFVGDRVLFLENNRSLGVLNGDLGSIGRIDPIHRTLTVKLDGQPENALPVQIPLRTYDHLQLGYARTTHKEQGATVEHSFVLLGGSMQSQEISFVQASRHRDEVRLYTDRFEAGQDLEDLARQMSTSSAKDMAHDVIRAASETEPKVEVAQQREREVPRSVNKPRKTSEQSPASRGQDRGVDRDGPDGCEPGGSADAIEWHETKAGDSATRMPERGVENVDRDCGESWESWPKELRDTRAGSVPQRGREDSAEHVGQRSGGSAEKLDQHEGRGTSGGEVAPHERETAHVAQEREGFKEYSAPMERWEVSGSGLSPRGPERQGNHVERDHGESGNHPAPPERQEPIADSMAPRGPERETERDDHALRESGENQNPNEQREASEINTARRGQELEAGHIEQHRSDSGENSISAERRGISTGSVPPRTQDPERDDVEHERGEAGGDRILTERREASAGCVPPLGRGRGPGHVGYDRGDSGENSIPTERRKADARSAVPERESRHAEQDPGGSVRQEVLEEYENVPPTSILEKVAMLRPATQGQERDRRVPILIRQIPPPSIVRER